eukprot:GHRR01023067.1.p1 GENE.GHRR01023067.1~~GHRR01023067.1.p1  ORF type:complete len:293 (+),score=96.18 GHRR01023067.1:832-1710(+)
MGLHAPYDVSSCAANRECPTDAVWYESLDHSYRWRQTAGEVQLQLLNMPDTVTSAKQLNVAIEPYNIRVLDRCTGEVYLDAELARGLVPEDSTWTFCTPSAAAGSNAAAATKHLPAIAQQAMADTNHPSLTKQHSRSLGPGSGSQAMVVVPAPATSIQDASGAVGEGRMQLYLAKMNLELYERPWQHSASWWPRLFADDPSDIAWDDEAKDYSDLPPAVAAAHEAAAAEEERGRMEDWERKEVRQKLQGLCDRHKRVRQERLNELKAMAWRRTSKAGTTARMSATPITAAIA